MLKKHCFFLLEHFSGICDFLVAWIQFSKTMDFHTFEATRDSKMQKVCFPFVNLRFDIPQQADVCVDNHWEFIKIVDNTAHMSNIFENRLNFTNRRKPKETVESHCKSSNTFEHLLNMHPGGIAFRVLSVQCGSSRDGFTGYPLPVPATLPALDDSLMDLHLH